jgi:hypothetical protein
MYESGELADLLSQAKPVQAGTAAVSEPS